MHIYTILKNRFSLLKGTVKMLTLFTVFFISAMQASAQVPPNDDVCGAIVLTPTSSCNYQTFTTQDASASLPGPNPNCENWVGFDVWFKVTVPAGATQITVDTKNMVLDDGGLAAYTATGTCPSLTLTQIACDGASSTNPDMGKITISPTTGGNVYYFRMWGGGGQQGTFGICVTANIPPANDECATATPLTVNPDYLCGAVTGSGTLNATQSSQPAPSCGNAAGFNDDVWFSFVATGPNHRIVLSNILPSATTMTMVVYSGTCGTLTEIAGGCLVGTSLDVTGLVSGQTYFVRVYTNAAAAATSATFNICVGTAPPPPPNDACSAATTLTVNADLNCGVTTAGTTVSATPTTGGPTPLCGNTAGPNDDVWYKFTATNTTHWISLSNILPTGTAMTFSVYTGTCAALVDVAGGCSTTSPLVLTGLVSGTVYYVRVYTNVATVGVGASFNICVGTPPPAPANDNCLTATTVTVNPDLNCGITTAGNTSSATPSAGAPTPSCGTAAGVNDDVWYQFTATNTTQWISLLNVLPSGTAMTFTVYNGTCGTLAEMAGGCSTTGLLALNTFVVGQVYYVRVYTNVATATTFASFNICVGTPVPPANDNCTGAIGLTVNANYNCGITTAATTLGASASSVPAPTCGNTAGINDDVWFSFVATGTGHRVSLLNVAPAGTAMTFAVYSGTCGALTQLTGACSTTGLLDLTGLVSGTTYYVRVFTNVATLTTSATFNICIGTPPPPPTNDECTGAISLTVNSDANCGIVTGGYTIGATQSTTLPAPTCGTVNGWNDDVWFSFVATNVNQQVSLSNIVGTSTNLTTVVYSGTCGNLTLIQCKNGPLNNLYGLTVGTTYYVRVYTDPTGTANSASFNICIGTIPPAVSGTICSAATPFCSTSQPSQNSPIVDAPGSPGLGTYSCLFSTPNPTWYVLQIATAGTLIITIHQQNAAGTGLDVDYAAYGPYTSVAQGCSIIGPSTPTVSCSYSAAADETVTIPNAQVGQFYILLVTNFSAQSGTITFGQGSGNTAATNCAIVCNATAGNSGPVCPGGTFNLTGSSSGNQPAFAWTGPGGYTSNQQNPTNVVAPSTPGTYVYTLTVTVPGNTCTATTTLTVLGTPAIALTSAAATTNQSVCTNSPITNITYSVTGATGATTTGLPTGVSGTYSGGVYTISGSPTVTGSFNYTITTSGGCSGQPATISGTITVTAGATLTLSSLPATTAQTVCIGSPVTNITYTTGNGATGATATGLPAGVTGTYSGGTFTITGTPTASGTFNYTVSTTGGCGTATQTGTLTVTNATITLSSAASTANQTVCVNTAITPITYNTGNGATGATVTGLPAGVTGTYAGGVFTISGTPTATGVFNYTVTATGCGTASLSGTITVSTVSTLTLSSAPATTDQNVCINSPIVGITYTVGGGGTGATVTGLPAGVTGTYSGGTFTISGTPTVNGTFPYTVTATGGCGTATQSGAITVKPASTIVLTSAASTANQTLCVNTPLTSIIYTTGNGATGATSTGLPAGVTGTYTGNIYTISGTPTASGSFPYTVSTTGGCGTATLSGTITVTAPVSLTLTSAASTTSQSVCVNTAITNITYAVTGGTGATVAGLPAGVTGTYSGGVFTISGTPTVAGPFSYTVTTTGGCGTASLSGTITVNTASTLVLTSAAPTANQTLCINTALTNIVYTTGGGATGATVTGLPAGVTGTYSGGTFTISGTPAASGTFPYTVTTTGGCGTATQSGNITVTAAATITLSSASGTSAQSVCVNTAITNITYTVTGGTSATVTGLPAGVSGTYSGGVFTISGTPTATGTFNYNVTTSGGCGTASSGGSIIVNTLSTLTLSSAAGTTAQTICANSAATSITYAIGGSATGATVTGLPPGVNGTYAGGVFTISGTATTAGTYTYSVTTTGGCQPVTRTGTITVNPALFANAGPTVTIPSGSSTQLNATATAGANYLWTANGPLALSSATILNPIANPLQTTTYTLTVSDPLNICPSASSSVQVIVVTSCINVRNAFSPNGDGINDKWYVYDQSFCLADGGVTVNVFNRYGSKVFESKNYRNSWDGTYKGKAVPDGTYYAVVEFTMSDNSKRVVRTDLTVLR